MKYQNDNLNDEDLEFEPLKQSNVYLRLRLITLFVLFATLVFSIVKNGYSLDFFTPDASEFEPICTAAITQQPVDDIALKTEKAKAVLKANQEKFSQLQGFKQALVVHEPIGYKGKPVAVIRLEFNQISKNRVRWPEKLCGFALKTIYK